VSGAFLFSTLYIQTFCSTAAALFLSAASFLARNFPTTGRVGGSGVGQERGNMLGTILIIILILLLIGALPTWPYSSGWGYYPGGGLGLILIIVLLLVLVGRI
jgi:hypothetical protein